MGTIAQNKHYYEHYDWSLGGDEWSSSWGSTKRLWQRSLLPRLQKFLPADRVVDIGAGHGRIAERLNNYVKSELVLIDITEGCVDACRRRFASETSVTVRLGDGERLPQIADMSADLVMSFYSLVHANAGTIDSYVGECARVLGADGAAFIHHSNAGRYFDETRADADPRQALLSMYRDVTMSAQTMQSIAKDNGLNVLRQECVNWDVAEILSDCFTILVRPGSLHDRPATFIENHDFRDEMSANQNDVRVKPAPILRSVSR